MINKLKELRAGGQEEGFTLIELMIVVVIIGILAAIAIPVFANQQKSAIDTGLKSDVKNLNTSIATALAKYPTAYLVEGSVLQGSPGDVTILAKEGDMTPAAIVPITVSDNSTDLDVTGAWNTYTINAINMGTGTRVIYDSATGKMTVS